MNDDDLLNQKIINTEILIDGREPFLRLGTVQKGSNFKEAPKR